MISDFLGFLRHENYAETTVEISRKWLEHFTARHPGRPRDLKPTGLTRYHKSLNWEPGPSGKMYSENTINQALGVLRAYFRWCIANGHLKSCPASHIKTRRVPDKARNILTATESRKLISLPNLDKPLGLRDRAILGLIIEEQASPSALHRLDLGDFQPDTGALLLQARTRRIVSLSSGLQADIERYIRLGRTGFVKAGEQALFVSRFGARMGGQGFLVMLKSYCRRAGISRPHFSS